MENKHKEMIAGCVTAIKADFKISQHLVTPLDPKNIPDHLPQEIKKVCVALNKYFVSKKKQKSPEASRLVDNFSEADKHLCVSFFSMALDVIWFYQHQLRLVLKEHLKRREEFLGNLKTAIKTNLTYVKKITEACILKLPAVLDPEQKAAECKVQSSGSPQFFSKTRLNDKNIEKTFLESSPELHERYFKP